IEPRHLEPAYVLWATCRLVSLDKVPRAGVVVRFDLPGPPKRKFWMLLRQPRAELCTAYPGQEEDLIVTIDAEILVQWNLRRVAFRELVRSGQCRLDGPPALIRAFPSWIRPSPFAHIASVRSQGLPGGDAPTDADRRTS